MVDSVPSSAGQQRSIQQVVKPILQAAQAPDNRAFEQRQLESQARASAPMPTVRLSGTLPMDGQPATDPRRSYTPTYEPQKPNSYQQPASQKESHREQWQSIPQSSEKSVPSSEPLTIMIQRTAEPTTINEPSKTNTNEQPTKRTTPSKRTRNTQSNSPTPIDQTQQRRDQGRSEVKKKQQQTATQQQHSVTDDTQQKEQKQAPPHQRITQAAIRAQGHARDLVMNVNYALDVSMHTKRQRLMQHVTSQESVSNARQSQLQQTI